MKLLICGFGVVGKATLDLLDDCGAIPDKCVEVYDPNIEEFQRSPMGTFDAIFICVNAENTSNGGQDLTAVKHCLELFKDQTACFLLRTTVLPGTTNGLAKSIGVPVFHFPEYLRETKGYESVKDLPVVTSCRDSVLLRKLFGDRPIPYVETEICEMTKYVQNSFFATKVTFANAIHDICTRVGLDYGEVIEATMETASVTGTISPECLQVPGPDGKFGFGGKCLPKDTAAFASFGRLAKSDKLAHFLSGILFQNEKNRKESHAKT